MERILEFSFGGEVISKVLQPQQAAFYPASPSLSDTNHNIHPLWAYILSWRVSFLIYKIVFYHPWEVYQIGKNHPSLVGREPDFVTFVVSGKYALTGA